MIDGSLAALIASIMGPALGAVAVIYSARHAINSHYSPENIRKKTREEALLKVRMDSVLEVIEEINKFSAAVQDTIEDVISLGVIIGERSLNRDISEEIINTTESIRNTVVLICSMEPDNIKIMLSCASLEMTNRRRAANRCFSNLIFLLEKDMILNEEKTDLKNCIGKIKSQFRKMQIIFRIKCEGKSKTDILNELEKARTDDLAEIEFYIEKILKEILHIYKEKLEAE